MSSSIDQLKSVAEQAVTRYRFLSSSERLILHFVVAVVVVLLLFSFIWLPVSQWKQRNASSLVANTTLLQQVNLLAPQASSVGGRGSARSNKSVVSLVLQSAARNKIEYVRYEPKGDNGIRLIMDGVSFNKLVKWLDQLDKGSGVAVSNISLEPQSSPGLVKATVELAAG